MAESSLIFGNLRRPSNNQTKATCYLIRIDAVSRKQIRKGMTALKNRREFELSMGKDK
jgi:hypothetical protein